MTPLLNSNIIVAQANKKCNFFLNFRNRSKSLDKIQKSDILIVGIFYIPRCFGDSVTEKHHDILYTVNVDPLYD